MIYDRKSPGGKRLLLGFTLGSCWCLVSLLILYFYPGPLERLDLRIYDLKLSLFESTEPSRHIVHLDVDDPAINEFGPWPWDRKMSARILNTLAELGAKAVVFDILYASHRTDEGDRAFFRALSRSGCGVLAVAPMSIGLGPGELVFEEDRSRADELYQRSWKLNHSSNWNLFEAKELLNCGLPVLTALKNSAAVGHINGTADSDGVHRKIPLMIKLADRVVPSLCLAALTRYLNIDARNINIDRAGRIEITHARGRITIPVNSQGQMLIRWRPLSEAFDSYSVLDLFDKKHDPTRAQRYRDKLVVVGVASTGSTDIGASSLETDILLSRVHSSAAETIISGSFIKQVALFPWLAPVTVVAAVAFLILAIWVPIHRAFLAFVAIIFGFLTVNLVGFFWSSVEIPIAQPMFILLPASMFGLVFHVAANEKERDAIKDTFGRYLSDEVVREILKSRGGVTLTGEMRDITILVSDLRGFTPLTESLPPMTILNTVNHYLEKMTDIIMRHQGTINEVMGDGILVFFGAPRALSDPAKRAVACALEMQASMDDLNAAGRERGLPELRMGIGISCGDLVVGNIGSEKRKKYGAIGSAINVAFRVEAQTVGGDILITPAIYERCAGDLEIDSTRDVRLKGIDRPLTLYHVVGIRQDKE